MAERPRVSWSQARDTSPLRLASRRPTEPHVPVSERLMDVVAPTTRSIPEAITRALPLTGEAWSVDDVKSALKDGNVGQAALIGGLSLLPMGGYLTAMAKRGTASVPKRMGQSGAIAWHGSPHKFDKFDMSKIGTGEGAQAYGHGLYLAESPEVAGKYAQKLDPMVQAARSGLDAEGTAARVLQAVDYNKERAIEELVSRKNMDHVKGNQEWADKMDATIAYIRGADKTSNLYKVDIPDEAVARFLDWDKPLSQQAPEVQKAIIGIRDAEELYKGRYSAKMQNPTGADVHETLADVVGNPNGVSQYLRDAGIPGIRYLDGGSRSAGKGSSNFVLFDDQLPRILERNGKATGQLPWSTGEWEGRAALNRPPVEKSPLEHLKENKSNPAWVKSNLASRAMRKPEETPDVQELLRYLQVQEATRPISPEKSFRINRSIESGTPIDEVLQDRLPGMKEGGPVQLPIAPVASWGILNRTV